MEAWINLLKLHDTSKIKLKLANNQNHKELSQSSHEDSKTSM